MQTLRCIGGKRAFLCFGRDGVSCTWAIYFRICGYGLHFSDRKSKDAYFSERYGYTKAWYPFRIRVELLTP